MIDKFDSVGTWLLVISSSLIESVVIDEQFKSVYLFIGDQFDSVVVDEQFDSVRVSCC